MKRKTDKITAIVPCYNEQEVLEYFYEEFHAVMEKMTDTEFELLFINDGSSDRTQEKIEELANRDSCIRYISFSRNFGKEAAIYAGLEHATGDYVAVMDADLQDPPSLLPEMYDAIINEGYDSVATRRVTRKGEPRIRSFFARRFYAIMDKISQTDMVDGARDYRLMNRKFVDALLRLKEYNRFSKGLYGWVGFRTKWLEYENVERAAGETKWSFWGLFRYSIEGIVAFSTAPLVLASLVGLIFCLIAFVFLVFIIVRRLVFGDPVDGWASIVSIILFLGGLQLLCIGILGQYLAKMYLEAKNRPVYLVGKTNIDQPEQTENKEQTETAKNRS
ncbi:MAG: glycosyltransferase family 2 protein [Eubacterium sp.]|nr:glycosyltransferase family 2 protein [Eubacterium sp.]